MKLKNLIFVFCIILNYYSILAAPNTDEVSLAAGPKINTKTELQSGGVTDDPPTPPETTTVAPETTTVTPETTTNPNTTTTVAPTTTVTPKTTTVAPTTPTTSTTEAPTPTPTPTPAPTPTPTSTPAPVTPTTTTTTTTTEVPPAPKPCRRFDGLSFIGGMILSGGLIPIGLLTWKFYKARTDRNYHTL